MEVMLPGSKRGSSCPAFCPRRACISRKAFEAGSRPRVLVVRGFTISGLRFGKLPWLHEKYTIYKWFTYLITMFHCQVCLQEVIPFFDDSSIARLNSN